MNQALLRDCKMYVGAYDLSGDMNAHNLDYKADVKDITVFNNTSHKRLGGIKTVMSKHEGVWQAGVGLVDDALFNNLGLANVPITVCPTTGAVGEPCYSFDALQTDYAPALKMDDALRFSVSAEGSDGQNLVRCTVMHNGAEIATGNGSIIQLGAVTSLQNLFGWLHVLAESGTSSPTLNVIVQSAATGGFGSPTTRITFNAATGIGYQSANPVAGPITDQYWRVSWTISGSTPSFTFVVSLGIQ